MKSYCIDLNETKKQEKQEHDQEKKAELEAEDRSRQLNEIIRANNIAVKKLAMPNKEFQMLSRSDKEARMMAVIVQITQYLQACKNMGIDTTDGMATNADAYNLNRLSDASLRVIMEDIYYENYVPANVLKNIVAYGNSDFGQPMDQGYVAKCNSMIDTYTMSDRELAITDRDDKLRNLSKIVHIANKTVETAGHKRLSEQELHTLYSKMKHLPEKTLDALLDEDSLSGNIRAYPQGCNQSLAITERSKVENIIDRIVNTVNSCYNEHIEAERVRLAAEHADAQDPSQTPRRPDMSEHKQLRPLTEKKPSAPQKYLQQDNKSRQKQDLDPDL